MEVESGQFIKPEKMTLKAFVKVWKEEYSSNPKNLSPTTRVKYDGIIKARIEPLYGHRILNEIKTIELVKYINSLEHPGARLDGMDGLLSTGTIDNIYKTLDNLFERAKDWKFIKENPMDTVSKPTVVHRKKEFYTEIEAYKAIETLFTAAPRKQRIMCLTAIVGGFRRGEVNGLQWPDCNFEDNSLSIINNIPLTEASQPVEKLPKSKSSIRRVKMPEWYMKELKTFHLDWLSQRMEVINNWKGEKREFVFHDGFGEPYYYQYPTKWWQKFCNKQNLRYITFHELRHSCASLILEDGMKNGSDADSLLKSIQELLGHSKLSTTSDIYTHVSEQVKDATAKKFDKFDPKNMFKGISS
jgi:integrase